MNKLLRFFMLTALLLPFALKAQTMYLTVADGTTTNAYVPVYGYYVDDYLRCQTIYPADMLTSMNGENILALTYYLSSPAASSWGAASFVVSIMEVTDNTLTGFLDITNATTVYTGSLDGTQSTMQIDFATPYAYQGGNLLIDVHSTAEGTYQSASFYGVTTTSASWQGYNSTSWSDVTGSVKNFIPKTTFMYGTPPTCFKVTNQTIDEAQTTTNSLTLTWTDALNTSATYDIYDMSDTTLVQSGVTGTSFTVNNLLSNTAYTFGIQTNCGGGDIANGYAIASGRTACGAISVLPFTEDFESVPTGSYQMPFCWERYVSAHTSAATYPYSYSSSTSAHGGSRSLYIYGTTGSTYSDTMVAIMPELDVTTYPMNGNRVTFWAKMGNASYTRNVYVGVMTNPADIATFTLVDSVLISGTTYTKYSVPMTNVNGAFVAFFVFKGLGTIYMDDVTLEEMPSCLEVTNLTVTATSSNSVSLSWVDAANNGATYTLYDMSDNTVVGSATGTTATIDNLTPNTTYTFGVQANCAAGDAPITTVTVLTDCADETMPWSEDFDNWTAKSPCWMFMSGLLSQGTPTVSTSAWALSSSYGSYITLSGKALTMNLYSTNRYWAVTPPIHITSNNVMLSVDVAVSAWSAAEPNYDDNDTLAFLVTTDNGATFTLLQALDYNQLNALGNTYTTLYVPASGYDGQTVRFAIYGGSVSGTSPHDNRIAIDNVSVSASSSCMPVANLTTSDVTSYGATLTWSSQATSYTIYNMADTTVVLTTTDTSVVISTLNPNTQYTLGVQANCGNEQSVFVNTTFTTLVTCPAPIDLTATLTPGNGTVATLSWDELGTAQAWQICLNGDTNNLIDVTSNPYDLTNLTPEQAYTAQVRAYCDANDQSEWSNLVNFTPTNSYLLTVNEGTTTNSYVPIYGLWVDDITKSQFIIPAADLTSLQFANINKLTFYSSNANVSWGAAEFNVYLTETTETTVSDLANYSDMTQVYAGTLSINNNIMEVTFTTPYIYMGGNLMIGFLQTVSGTYSSCSWYGVSATGASMGGYGTSISQRNFLPKTMIAFTPGTQPSCMPVTSLNASNITTSGVTLTWVDNNNTGATYSIYNMADTSVVVSGVSTTSYDITGLTPSTNYIFGVVADCSPSSSSNIITVGVNTACAAVTLPYTETFEGTSNTRNCWDLVSMNSANDVGTNYGMGFMNISGHDVLRFSSYSSASDYNQYGFSPLMDVSSTATYLRADVTYATYGTDDYLYFGYVTATDTVWETTAYQTASNSSASTWETATVILPANATQLAIHYYGNYAYYAWIDTVVINEMTGSFCFPVTDLTVDNTTENTATISWNGTAASYDVYKDGVFVANVTTDTYTFTGLTAATAYTFGVQALCSATDTADMVTITATTECSDITALPYNEGFENGLGCWTTLSGSTDGNPWNAQAAFSSGAIAPHTGSGMAASWSWNSSAMHANAWLISPKFVLPNTTEPITFTWWERTNASYPDRYSVVLSTTTNDTAAFTTVVRPYDTAAGSWTMQTVDLSAYAGQSIYIAFHHVDYDKNYLLIDDISLYQGGYIPPAPDTLTVTFAVNNPAMGTTTPAPGTYTYITGDTVFFSATANTSYHFIGWEFAAGTNVDTLGAQYISAYFPANAMMSYGSITLTALFEAGLPDSTTITYAVNDPTLGTTSPAPGTYTIYVGGSIDATAIPNAGSQLSAWMLDIYLNGSVISSDTTLSTDANFANPMHFGTLPQTFADYGATITITAVFTGAPVEPCAVPTGLAVAANGLHNESIDVIWNNADVDGWNIQWRVANGAWASGHSTTNSYTISGLAMGTTYEIQVQADCGDNNLSDWSASITATTTNVGVDSYLESSVSLYPNPAREYVDIRIDGDVNVKSMEVYDVYGKLINTVNVIENPTRIYVSNLANGMYFVRVSTEAGMVTKTFVKK